MKDTNPLVRAANEQELRFAEYELMPRSYNLFLTVGKVLRNPQCLQALRCHWLLTRTKPSEAEIADRTRRAFNACMLSMTRQEISVIRLELAWYTYMEEHPSVAAHLDDQTVEMENDPDFRAWCQEHSLYPLRSYKVFQAFINSATELTRKNFEGIWKCLSKPVQLELLTKWYRLLNGACCVEPRLLRGERVFVVEFPGVAVPVVL